MVKEAGAKIVEANLSCPNEGTSNLVCHDCDLSRAISWAIKSEIGDTPLLLKTAYFPYDGQLREFVLNIGDIADGVSSINTIPAEIIDEKGNHALPGEKEKEAAYVATR